MKVTLDVPQIVNSTFASHHGGGTRMWLEFDAEPNVALGDTYRTFVVFTERLSARSDHGTFRALWRDGRRLLVDCLDGWTPTNAHGMLP